MKRLRTKFGTTASRCTVVLQFVESWQSFGLLKVGQFGGLSDDVEALKRDKNVLMAELVRVRHQQQVVTTGSKSFALTCVIICVVAAGQLADGSAVVTCC